MGADALIPRQVTIQTAATLLSYSERMIYRLLAAGVLPSNGSGRLRRIPVTAIDGLQTWLNSGGELWDARIDPNGEHRPAKTTASRPPRRPASTATSTASGGQPSVAGATVLPFAPLQKRTPKRRRGVEVNRRDKNAR
jgi:excisionase family DNA binding protein